MRAINYKAAVVCAALVMIFFQVNCMAAHVHTHIGVNQDKVWGTADDDKLWFFSPGGTEGWPGWGYQLEMVPTGTYNTENQQLYVCEYLYCWHTGHPADGSWQLPGSSDQSAAVEWEIELQRVSFDDGFFMLDGRDEVLSSDGSSYAFDDVEWMADKYNNNGELGSWGFHSHLYFYAWADGEGEVFDATFKALDMGTTGLESCDDYTISFVTVPEPGTCLILTMGTFSLLFKRRS